MFRQCNFFNPYAYFVIRQHLPSFGPYLKERERIIAEDKKAKALQGIERELQRDITQPNAPVKRLQEFVGKAVSKIGAYGELTQKEQVVALIDEVSSVELKYLA